MLNRIKTLLSGSSAPEGGEKTFEDATVAAAALMVAAARMDEVFGPGEQAVIKTGLKQSFGLSDEEITHLLTQAERENEEANDLFGWTRKIKEACNHEERVALVERLWELVYADGHLDDLEASMLRRVSGLVYVPDRESGAARIRARKKLGLD